MKIEWTEEMLDYLRLHYPTDPLCDMAPVLGCSDTTIREKAKALGLVKSKDFHSKNFYGRYTGKRRVVNVNAG